jgi:glycosyltransferase involved in cell wall biosynthesis
MTAASTSTGHRLRICFFANVESHEALERVQFYATDLRILRDLGHDVVVATRFAEIPRDCDLYFIWWWTYAFLPLIKGRLAGRPCVVTGVFDYDTCAGLGSVAYVDRPVWQRLLMRGALSFADINAFISRYEFEQVPHALPVNKPRLIPLVVDTDRYSPAPVAKKPYFLNVAWSGEQNAKRKCLPQVIQAFALVAPDHPELRLVMAGKQGEYHARLVALAAELGVRNRVDFLGIISEEEKIMRMRECYAYLQPTLFEGFGLAIAEAMACGAAVVSSPVGAIPEVVGDAGLMVEGSDHLAIADALRRLLSQTALRDDLARRAVRHVCANFSYSRRRQGIADLIADLV